MIGKRRSVQPATFALALSTLGASWASRLEARSDVQHRPAAGGFFKRTSRCHASHGLFATIICLLGLSV
jgi:hypothetical protein